MWSNGWYLYTQTALELGKTGVTNFMLSAYSDDEHRRFMELKKTLPAGLAATDGCSGLPVYFHVRRATSLDDRMETRAEPQEVPCTPFFRPLRNLTIRSNRNLGLCC